MTTHRGQATGRVNEAQDEPGDAVGTVVTGASSTEVEEPRQQARSSTRSGTPDRRARALHLGQEADRVVKTQGELGAQAMT